MSLKKVFGIIVIALLLIVIGWAGIVLYYDSKPKPAVELEQSTAPVSAIVKINFADKQLDYPVRVAAPATVLTALQAIKDLPVETKDYGQLGVLITKIGDVANGQEGKYWQYWLNGVYATVGAGQQAIKTNDIIQWKFTNEGPEVK
ncbi:MAG: DUF4430 domain-containing protein [Candidatus Komeilibacteria bacterium]|nr:DUF4430 domain-containing protein [Candidatus Komeilibacteria bacterium]